MKILFLTQVLPYPLDAGPKVRAYYVLRHLTKQHRVTLIAFVRPTDTPEAIRHLAEFCQAVHPVPMARSKARDGYHLLRSLATGQPFLIARDWRGVMATQLRAHVQAAEAAGAPYDAIHADQLWMAPYALLAQGWQASQQPMTVLDQHNAVFMIPERLADEDASLGKRLLLRLEASKLARYEATICRRFDHVVWVTQEDYQAVQRSAQQRGHVVPCTGVIPICGDSRQQPPIVRQIKPHRVTFVGGLHYPPNAQGICWFAEQVFPQVLRHAPQAVLTVIGKAPPPALHALGIPAEKLEVTGFLDNVEPYLAETAAFIVPLLAGGGMRVKIIDGWRWGMPVVSTTIGAEGIATCPGQNILIADRPAELAAQIGKLIQQPTVADGLATAGRQWFEAHYDWRTIYQQWDRIYL
ncbi:MAG: glycosyltransferase [Caldilineaceae bacterium]